jgi:hypothetical protein
VWVRGATEDEDEAVVPVETHDVAVLGQIGLVRFDPDPTPLHEKIHGSQPSPRNLRSRPAMNEGRGRPRPWTYRRWQSDAFGGGAISRPRSPHRL